MTYAKNKLEAMFVEVLFPAEVEVVGEEAVLPFVDVAPDWLLLAVVPAVPAVAAVPEALLFGAFDPLAVELGDREDDDNDDDDADGSRLEGRVTLAHERSYNGDVFKVLSLVLLPRRPKLGFGAVGAAS